MSTANRTLKTMSNVKEAFIQPFPNSQKIYVEGSRTDIQVPMREITLTDTIGELAEKNDPIHVYDTSGVYTDPSVQIDLRKGLDSSPIPHRIQYSNDQGDLSFGGPPLRRW